MNISVNLKQLWEPSCKGQHLCKTWEDAKNVQIMKNEWWLLIFCYNIRFYLNNQLEINSYISFFLFLLLFRSNCAENIRKHILHTGKHEGVKMYNCPRCDYGTNIPVEFRNHLKELHPDIENPDLAYLHAGKVLSPFAYKFFSKCMCLNDCNKKTRSYYHLFWRRTWF